MPLKQLVTSVRTGQKRRFVMPPECEDVVLVAYPADENYENLVLMVYSIHQKTGGLLTQRVVWPVPEEQRVQVSQLPCYPAEESRFLVELWRSLAAVSGGPSRTLEFANHRG